MHNLQLGVEYAPMFTDPTIHNLGFTFLGTSSTSVWNTAIEALPVDQWLAKSHDVAMRGPTRSGVR